jgi:ABC-type uncharacterized transport system ATPase subunit
MAESPEETLTIISENNDEEIIQVTSLSNERCSKDYQELTDEFKSMLLISHGSREIKNESKTISVLEVHSYKSSTRDRYSGDTCCMSVRCISF